MDAKFFTAAEFAARSGADEAALASWAEAKLLAPAGLSAERLPFYSEAELDRAAHIRRLEQVGYGTEQIRKILRKIGLPREERRSRRRASRVARHLLTVGRLAERSGVSPRTIKHWEEVGILEPDMRTGGGFRLYGEAYVFLCRLVRDLQLFGCSLEEIKAVSGHVRDFLALRKDIAAFPPAEAAARIAAMQSAADALRARMARLEEGIERWKDLLKKKRREIAGLAAAAAKPSGGGGRTGGGAAGTTKRTARRRRIEPGSRAKEDGHA